MLVRSLNLFIDKILIFLYLLKRDWTSRQNFPLPINVNNLVFSFFIFLKSRLFWLTKPRFWYSRWHHKTGAQTSEWVWEESHHFVRGSGSCRREAKRRLWGGSEQVPIFRMCWTHNSGLMNVSLRCNSLFRACFPPLQLNTEMVMISCKIHK